MVYLLLAGISTPLVLSVHSIVSFDFAVSGLPGWHATIFRLILWRGHFSGFAMVVTLMCLVRVFVPQFKNYITVDHLEAMNRIIMLTGLMVGYAYGMEFFMACIPDLPMSNTPLSTELSALTAGLIGL